MSELTTADPAERPIGGRIVAVLAVTGVVVSVSQTLVIPLITTLPERLATSPANASWVVTATLLAGALSTPILGRLGDMHGKRRMIIVCLVLLLLGSVVSALSSSLTPMVVGRVLQGAAVGAIPLGVSILRDELSEERLPAAVGIISATLGVGGAVGLPIAATVAMVVDWHWLFWGGGAMAACCLVLVLTLVPESPVTTPAPFDFVGALGLVTGLSALLVAMIKGNVWGWSNALTIGLLASGVVVMAGWTAYELRVRHPLVDLRVSARKPVLFTYLASVTTGFAMYAMTLILPFLAMTAKSTGYGFGLNMVQAGLLMMPTGLVMMAASPASALLTRTRGPKTTVVTGLLIMGVAYAVTLLARDDLWQLAAAAALMGAGVGFAYAAMPALIMRAVPVEETAAANSLNTLMISIGTTGSAAVIGALLATLVLADGAPTELAFDASFGTALLAVVGALCLAVFIPAGKALR